MIEQEPGPRGSPHEPHGAGPKFLAALVAPDEPTAKTESCFSR